jgi:hypothetical protein
MKDFHVKEWVQTHAKTVSEWVKTHKPHTAGIITATIVAIALIVATASGAFAPAKHAADHSVEPTTNSVSDKDKAKPADVGVNVKADDGWTKDSTPVILHVKEADKSDDKDAVDFYHAVSPTEDNKASDTISLKPGKYTVEVISPLNSDGSAVVVYNTSGDSSNVSVVSQSTITVTEPVKASADKDDNKIDITLNKVPAEQVTDDMVKTIVDKTKTAVDNGDTTLKGDAGKEVLDKVETNAKANPNITEATTEKAEENKTAADPTTTPSTNKSNADATEKSNAGTAKSSGNNSASKATQAPAKSSSNTSSGSSSKPAEKPKKWVPEQGHYEDVTEQVWVSNWVEEPVYETKKVYVGEYYVFPEDGYKTTDADDEFNHSIELMKKGYKGNFHYEPIYDTQTVQTGTKKVDKGGYQTKVTGKRWVVDVPGHYE